MHILHNCPHNGQATGFRREGVNLISPLPNIAKEAFDRIRAANVTMHDRWKSVKRQKMLLIFAETADGFGISLLVFDFKSD
jgi:O-succinylbenzoate synthase